MKANTNSVFISKRFQCGRTGRWRGSLEMEAQRVFEIHKWRLNPKGHTLILQYNDFKVSSLSDLELKLLLDQFSGLRENFGQIQGLSLGLGLMVEFASQLS
jgi:hypothetical protein